MPMLNGKLSLHGVHDVEALCNRVVDTYERKTNTRLRPADREDCVAYLIAAAWETAEFSYDPKRGGRFDQHLTAILSFRVTDWIRLDEGRTKWQFSSHTYERPKTTVLSLDQPAHSPGDDGDSGGLGELVAVHDSGDETDFGALMGRLLRERNRCMARDKHILRQSAYQTAA